MYLYLGGAAAVLAALILLVLFFSTQKPSTALQTSTGSPFGTGNSIPISNTGDSGAQATNIPQSGNGQVVFKIADGPIAGATLSQTSYPTTTVARYVLQNNGHIFQVPVNTPGAVPKAISNTTIPGFVRVWWVTGGNGLIGQYVDGGVVKTLYLGLPPQNATTTQPVKIQFLPQNITDLAPSPDGTQIVYLLRTASGVDGYTAAPDGTGGKRLFSFPLSEVLISWPSKNAILLQTKSGVGVPGGAFSIAVSSGAITPLVYAQGLTATANRSFSDVLYQTTSAEAPTRSTYAHNIKSGIDRPLSFDPFPEKCLWSALATSTAICASPLQYVAPNFLDLWHQGAASSPDGILSFDLTSGTSDIIAIPGGSDGGVSSDIAQMALSPDEHYLLFVTKGDRSVWGVRLTQ
jgi:hypothetical protein